jgi:hypothetical protein
MIKNFTILLLLAFTTRCTLKQKPEFIKVDAIQLVDANSRQITLSANAVFNNPNSVGGRLNTEGVSVLVNGVDFGFISAEEFKVPAKDKFTVPLQIVIKTKELLGKDPNGFLSGLLNSVLNKNLKVKYKGVIEFKALGFTYKYPIDKTETVNIKL